MTKYLISFPGWAAKLAVACRCAQELRAFAYDLES